MNKIWIELKYPTPENMEEFILKRREGTGLRGNPTPLQGDREIFACIQCDLANKIFEKLGKRYRFWWWGVKGIYCITLDEGGGYKECRDNGHWFNLDFLVK